MHFVVVEKTFYDEKNNKNQIKNTRAINAMIQLDPSLVAAPLYCCEILWDSADADEGLLSSAASDAEAMSWDKVVVSLEVSPDD